MYPRGGKQTQRKVNLRNLAIGHWLKFLRNQISAVCPPLVAIRYGDSLATFPSLNKLGARDYENLLQVMRFPYSFPFSEDYD